MSTSSLSRRDVAFNKEDSPSTRIKKIHGVRLEQSSKASSQRHNGLSSSNMDRIPPRVEFWKRMEYYLTIGRVQNVVESYVLDIMNREWYYDDTSEGAYEQQILQ